MQPALSPAGQVCLRLGDTCLLLAQHLAQWCGHAPTLEEDLALANIALDLLGQARGLLTRAGELEGAGRDEDDLAYLREADDFTNLLLAEVPGGDFGQTVLRQFLFDAYAVELWDRLSACVDPELAGVAAKAVKEARYHLRHTGGWVVRLGDGTPQSHERMLAALAVLWPYTAELFTDDEADLAAARAGVAPLPSGLLPGWRGRVEPVLLQAQLPVHQVSGGSGRRPASHTEHLAALLAELQSVHRAHPGVRW